MEKKSNKIEEQMSVGAGAIAGMPTANPPEQTPVGLGKKFKVLRRKQLERKNRVTTKAIGRGMHEVYVNGEKHNDLSIISGSAGVSGYVRNLYGVYSERANKPMWIGSLEKTRDRIEQMVNEMDEVPAAGPGSGAVPTKATNINTEVSLKKAVKIKPFKSMIGVLNSKKK